MMWINSRGKGLLLKSFFVCFLFSFEVNAKTLIFQSSSERTSNAQVSEKAPSAASPDIAAPVVTPPVSARSGGSNVNSELFFMVEQLTQEVMQLRGLLEEQGYKLQQLETTAKDRYRDLDGRILQLSKEAQVSVTPKVAVASVPLNGPAIVPVSTVDTSLTSQGSAIASEGETDAQKAEYQAAYAFVRDKQFPEAVDALHKYVEKYPTGNLTGNAFYWLGEVYLAIPKLEQAKQALMIVVKTFPGHRKQADAMYKLAIAFDRLQDPAKAEIYLKAVQQEFPGSTAAKLAESYAINR